MTEPAEQPLLLVADDDEEFREELIPTAMREINARVLKAVNVTEACRIGAEHGSGSADALELVVLDMHMPLHDGTGHVAKDGGLRFLRSVVKLRCPVVVFTAWPDFRSCVSAIRAGASAYLPKMSQDSYMEGREGGIDDLVATSRRLLEYAPPKSLAFPPLPDPMWIRENYEWLCKRFGGMWVAFLDPRRACEAGIDIEGRDHGILSNQTEDELRRFLTTKAPYLGYLPEVLWVPYGPFYHDQSAAAGTCITYGHPRTNSTANRAPQGRRIEVCRRVTG